MALDEGQREHVIQWHCFLMSTGTTRASSLGELLTMRAAAECLASWFHNGIWDR
jgi:hypothetical protein